jgi:hypothetical protein
VSNSNELYRLTKENYELKIRLLQIEQQKELQAIKARGAWNEFADESDYDDGDNDTTTALSAKTLGLDYAKAKSFIQGLEPNREYAGLWIINELIGRSPNSRGEKKVCTNFLNRITSLELAAPIRGGKSGKRDSEFGRCFYYRRVMPSIGRKDDEQ